MAKTVNTPNGTALPLLNLKGKDYLMVAHRIQWFNEVEKNFDITTEFLLINDEQTICRATVHVKDETGKILRSVTATKRETKKDFPDHTEKSETSAIGRAISLLGYGTQFALADLDEGMRLADSPVVDVKAETKKAESQTLSAESVKAISPETPKASGGFKKPGVATVNGVKDPSVTAVTIAKTDDGGWQ